MVGGADDAPGNLTTVTHHQAGRWLGVGAAIWLRGTVCFGKGCWWQQQWGGTANTWARYALVQLIWGTQGL